MSNILARGSRTKMGSQAIDILNLLKDTKCWLFRKKSMLQNVFLDNILSLSHFSIPI